MGHKTKKAQAAADTSEPEVTPAVDATADVVLSAEEHARLQAAAHDAEQHHDQLLRLRAEWDNAKKRLEREKQDYAKWASESLVLQLLPIVDSFDAALQSLKHHDGTDPVVMGVKLINQQLHELLTREGVERLTTIGQPYDPERHEVMQQVETTEHDDNIVMEEIQAGYLMKGRLIRPAMVKVAITPKPKDEDASTEEQDNG
jgi:molecular chaperone GrpE